MLFFDGALRRKNFVLKKLQKEDQVIVERRKHDRTAFRAREALSFCHVEKRKTREKVEEH